jgi:hypothetical protein
MLQATWLYLDLNLNLKPPQTAPHSPGLCLDPPSQFLLTFATHLPSSHHDSSTLEIHFYVLLIC